MCGQGWFEPPTFRFQLDSGGRGTRLHSRGLGLPTGIWGTLVLVVAVPVRFVRPIFVCVTTS
jgi:hypothetical protein